MSRIRTILARGQLGALERGPGFSARTLRDQAGDALDPFLSIDLFRMSRPTFPPHPHAGFSAVTVMLEDSEGAFINRDSLGDRSRIGPGDLHWTQAGRGMMHEEVPEVAGQECHGLQVFVNLSAQHELAAPRAFHLDASEVPVVEPAPGARVRVLAGSALGASSPLKELLTPVLMLDIELAAGGTLELPLPAADNAFALVLEGEGSFGGGAPSGAYEALGFRRDGERVHVRSVGRGPLRLFLGSGAPLGEPVVFAGPFALSSEQRALEARRRFSRGEMGQLAPSR